MNSGGAEEIRELVLISSIKRAWKPRRRTMKRLILIGMMAAAFSACGGGGGSSSSPPTVDVTGNWAGSWLSKNGSAGSLSIAFTQTGATLSGTVSLGGSSCFSAGNISGTVSGNNIISAGVFSGSLRVDFDGTAANNQISGSYNVENGGACTSDTGTWTVSKQ